MGQQVGQPDLRCVVACVCVGGGGAWEEGMGWGMKAGTGKGGDGLDPQNYA
jgi:hypothetical protein